MVTAGSADARGRLALVLVLVALLVVVPALLSPGPLLFPGSSSSPSAAPACAAWQDGRGDVLRAELPTVGLHAPNRVDQHRIGLAKASPARAQRRAPAAPSGDVLVPGRPDGRQGCDRGPLTRRGPPGSGA